MRYMIKLKRNRVKGFTLIETIITLVLLCVISLVCIGILTSALSARSDIETKLRDQIALRQAVLAITSEIRIEPEESGPNALGPIANRYYLGEDEYADVLFRKGALGAVATDISAFNITINDGRAEIYIRSVGGQVVTTTIFIRAY